MNNWFKFMTITLTTLYYGFRLMGICISASHSGVFDGKFWDGHLTCISFLILVEKNKVNATSCFSFSLDQRVFKDEFLLFLKMKIIETPEERQKHPESPVTQAQNWYIIISVSTPLASHMANPKAKGTRNYIPPAQRPHPGSGKGWHEQVGVSIQWATAPLHP